MPGQPSGTIYFAAACIVGRGQIMANEPDMIPAAWGLLYPLIIGRQVQRGQEHINHRAIRLFVKVYAA